MKAIKLRIQKFSRPLVILLATVVVIITSIVVANATQTITTPNAAFISFSLASGANSPAITPVSSRSVLVMGCCTDGLAHGVSQVSLLHLPSDLIQWIGLEDRGGTVATIIGASSTAGTHIMYFDGAQRLDIQVASKDTILIHNGDTVTLAGNVTLVW
jgi:hypothetical protein